MRTELAMVLTTIIILVAIGAWLVTENHPWFGLLVILLAGTITYSSK